MAGSEELEQFKQLNLSLYATNIGDVLDARRTNSNMAVMKHPATKHEIVILSRHR